METSAPAAEDHPVLVHRRTIEFDAYDLGATVSVRARLRDDRPWAAREGGVEHLHDMELHLEVDKDDLTIVAARAAMDRYPHAECPAVTGDIGTLVGLSVSRGYTRAVQDRFGGAAGCTHLEQLARAAGPVVVQTVTSCRALARRRTPPTGDDVGTPTVFPPNTCHVWAEGGPGQQKLVAGWRPGDGGYPAPPVAVVLQQRRRPG